MAHFRKGHIFIPFMVLLMLIGSFKFAKHLDKQVDKYSVDVHMKKWEEEQKLCQRKKYGPSIYFKETPQVSSKLQH